MAVRLVGAHCGQSISSLIPSLLRQGGSPHAPFAKLEC